ncbi:hypothetical protein Kpol_2002p67 [Vanderwaltozyma polyspora DSM 70294]|uniref:Replication factor A protein 3 n=1 Tax=Vanderwaltozyma polyspora (strain ATCC 22028 / DSM 70294 / BCRC 21397 / CBS 2163 / NBRC 10782 / NRRL Y-8283 / UCD 57-17) TaxID=436907 RepID=A7TFI2_VANPO|nr:uncharacterized protein Kpol_2002p67 [Vanderwaltozyma polyspora DSM 70294]EDO18996.1 hypothetical protein Kpol_2002p67 [Vanderwaltozyma polyspora DSM 70294]
MASETPRLDPREIAENVSPVFRLIAQVKSQPSESSLVLSSPSEGGEMITLSNVRVSMNREFDTDAWYEFVCRSSDSGEVGFLVLDAVPCILEENEQISIDGIVALQQLTKKFPEIY